MPTWSRSATAACSSSAPAISRTCWRATPTSSAPSKRWRKSACIRSAAIPAPNSATGRSPASSPKEAIQLNKDNHLRGILFLLGSGIVFTILDSLAKETSPFIPVLQFAWGRYVFHVVFLPFYAERPTGAPIWSATRWMRMFAPKHPCLQVLRSLLLLGATWFFFGAVSYVPLAE